MKMIRTALFAALTLVALGGCHSSNAPEQKPPAQAEGTRDSMGTQPSAILDQLEKLPASERQGFLDRHERDMASITNDPQMASRLQRIMSGN